MKAIVILLSLVMMYSCTKGKERYSWINKNDQQEVRAVKLFQSGEYLQYVEKFRNSQNTNIKILAAISYTELTWYNEALSIYRDISNSVYVKKNIDFRFNYIRTLAKLSMLEDKNGLMREVSEVYALGGRDFRYGEFVVMTIVSNKFYGFRKTESALIGICNKKYPWDGLATQIDPWLLQNTGWSLLKSYDSTKSINALNSSLFFYEKCSNYYTYNENVIKNLLYLYRAKGDVHAKERNFPDALSSYSNALQLNYMLLKKFGGGYEYQGLYFLNKVREMERMITHDMARSNH